MPNQISTNDDANQTPTNELSIEYRLALQKHVLDRLFAEHKELLESYKKQFAPGDKKTAQNPQGVNLASFSMSAPKKVAVCTDPAILAAMAEEKNMELVDVLPRDADRLQELLNHVYETRPDLLDVSISKDDEKELSEKVFKDWLVTGELPAGWEIKEASSPSFRVTKARSEQAKAVIDHLFGQAADILEINPGKEA